MKILEEIKNIVEEAEVEANKFYVKKNMTAGTRLRKAMQEIKTLAQNLRKEVQDLKKSS